MSLLLVYYGYWYQVPAIGSDGWSLTPWAGLASAYTSKYTPVIARVLFLKTEGRDLAQNFRNTFSWRNYNRGRTNSKAYWAPPVLYLLSGDLELFLTSLYFTAVWECKFWNIDQIQLMLRSHLTITINASYNSLSIPEPKENGDPKAHGQPPLLQREVLCCNKAVRAIILFKVQVKLWHI